MIRTLARLAAEADSPALAAEAEALAERLREGRFYVVCVGQFKRGKSTLVNALVGESVLPTGVVPITSAITVIPLGLRLGGAESGKRKGRHRRRGLRPELPP